MTTVANPFVINNVEDEDDDQTLQELEYTYKCSVIKAKTQIVQMQMDLIERLSNIVTACIDEDEDFCPMVEKTMNSISLIIDTLQHNKN